MSKCTWFLIVATALVGVASAQFEVNGPNATLTINGMAPGANALHDVTVPTPGTVTLTFGSGANMNAGIILVGSNLDTTGPVSPTPWGGTIDLGTPGFLNMGLIANGVSPTTFSDALFNTGFPRTMSASFSVAQCSNFGTRFAVQAVIQDPTMPPFLFDNTEAGDMNFGASITTLVGDDVLAVVDLGCSPCMFYGVMHTTMRVSTNGFIKLGGSGTSSDLSESANEMINGLPGASGLAGAMIGVLWEDLDMGNVVPGQMVIIDRSSPGFITVTWQNGDYFPATPFGTVSCTIDCTNGNVTLDYTGYIAPAPNEGIVGVSAGMVSATVTAHDLAAAGVVNPLASTPGSVATIFQSFDGAGVPSVPLQPFDLAGLVLNFTNTTGSDYSLN